MKLFNKKKKNKFKESVKKFWNKIKNKISRKKEIETYSFKEVLIIMIFSIGLGIIMTLSVINLSSGGSYLKNTKSLNKLLEVYNTINENYYGEIDKDKLIESAINGMLSSVSDPYTTYIDKETTEEFLQKVNGKYEGIGCEIGMTLDSKIIIATVFEDTPSYEAGLKVGDIVIKVDGTDYQDKTSSDVANYIKNSNKEEITMTVVRGEEEINLIIKRGKIEIPSVSTEIYEQNNKKIGYLNISIFSSITDKQFDEKLKELETNQIDGLIIDVRDNTGGYLDAVTDICNSLLPKDKIIYQLESSSGKTIKYDTTKEQREYPIAIITNKNSASASEILAGVIKESYGGYVVGTNTYGKGTVQQTHNMSDGSMIKYTTQKWLTPNGNFIDKVGIEPTHYVELTEEYLKNPTIENDAQFQKALSILSE